ncbi:hypothetical protein AB0L59_11635 [Streptomyces sp. NPDC052109]|uniref:hypothetical protein n=1 Tax=Streptomyces sp. NPDC052109 TaxID=3155527 RepID=UPI003447CFDD
MRTAAALAVAAVALAIAYGTAHAASRTLAPGLHRATVTAPGQDHDPKEDTELDGIGSPDLDED